MKSHTLPVLAALAALFPAILAAQTAAPAAPAAPAAAQPAQPATGARQGAAAQPGGPGAGGGRGGGGGPAITLEWNDAIPAGNAEHAARALSESPRHGEWVDVKFKDGAPLKSWVVYPERAGKAGVVIVIHDIRGMSDIARAVGDQLAQDGFIAIVPDFLSGKGPDGGGTASLGTGVGQAIQGLTDMTDRLDAVMAYGKTLPASNGKTGVVGFCWGGAQSFSYAAAQPNLNAAVVFYGQAPATMPVSDDATVEKALANIKAPVLGLYGGADGRINNTLPQTEAAMTKLGKSFQKHIYEGAGHGFMGNQGGSAGANLKAAQQSWPVVLEFYRKHLG